MNNKSSFIYSVWIDMVSRLFANLIKDGKEINVFNRGNMIETLQILMILLMRLNNLGFSIIRLPLNIDNSTPI